MLAALTLFSEPGFWACIPEDLKHLRSEVIVLTGMMSQSLAALVCESTKSTETPGKAGDVIVAPVLHPVLPACFRQGRHQSWSLEARQVKKV